MDDRTRKQIERDFQAMILADELGATGRNTQDKYVSFPWDDRESAMNFKREFPEYTVARVYYKKG